MVAKFCIVLIAVIPFTTGGIISGIGGGGHGEDEGYSQITDLKHLGTFVGHPNLPPKVIKIIKTVAVKVPVPYPVKIPHSVPVPVPVAKPYPIKVPHIIKIKEQVPVPVHAESYGGGYGGSSAGESVEVGYGGSYGGSLGDGYGGQFGGGYGGQIGGGYGGQIGGGYGGQIGGGHGGGYEGGIAQHSIVARVSDQSNTVGYHGASDSGSTQGIDQETLIIANLASQGGYENSGAG